jgi:hypothetical protein
VTKIEPSARWYNWATHFLGRYIFRDLALWVAGVSNETVKYGHEFCGTWTQRVTALARPRSNCTVNYRPVLSSERAHHIKKPTTVRQ